MAEALGAFIPDTPPPMPTGVGGFVPDEPDPSAINSHVKTNIKEGAAKEANAGKGDLPSSPGKAIAPPPHPAEGIIDAFESGWQTSATGLLSRGKLPDTILPQDAGRAMKLAAEVGGTLSDLPLMIASGGAGAMIGAPAGGAVGTAVLPGVGTLGGIAAGTAMGAGAAAFAVPAAMRKMLMDHYEKGDITSAADFADRAVGAAWEATKGAITGIATEATGGLATPYLAPLAVKGAQVAAMVTMSKGLEGHLPEAQDFVNGALILGGLHYAGAGAEAVSQKLRGAYEGTGAKPADAIPDLISDPVTKPKILSDNIPGNQIEIPGYEKPAQLPMTEEQMTKDPGKVISQFAKESPNVKTELSDAENSVLSRVGEEQAAPKKKVTFDDLYTDHLDFLNNLKTAVDAGAKVTPDSNAYNLGRTMAAYTDKTREFFTNATYDFETGKPNGEALKPIIDSATEAGGGNTDKFTAFVVAKRAIEKEGQGIKTGVDLEAAKKVVAENEKTMGPIQRRFVDYNHRVLDYYADSGMLSASDVKNIKSKNFDYASFARILEPDPLTGKMSGNAKPVNEMSGNDQLLIKDPVLSAFKATDRMIKAAQLNNMKSSFVDQMLGSAKDDPILRRAENQNTKLGDQHLVRYVDGEKEVFEGNPGVLAGLNSFEGNEAGASIFTKLMKPFAQATRLGFTTDPGFAFRHFFRAQMFSGLTSKTGLVPFVHPALALGDFFGGEGGKGSELYHQWLYDGGAQRGFEPIDKGYIENQILKLDKNVPFQQQAWNVIKTPFQAAHAFIVLSDNLTRFAEYKRSPGIAEGTADMGQRTQAAMNSREVTPDYSRVGAKMAAIQSTVSFYNAGLQGMDLAARTFKNDPVGSTAKALAYYTVPALLTWYATHDDERYKSLPSWEKNLYLNVPYSNWRKSDSQESAAWPEAFRRQNSKGDWEVNDGGTFKIPQTFDVGLIFGSLPMRVLDAYKDKDPSAMHDFMKSLGEKLPGLPIANALSAPVEQMTNYNFFTGSPIVPDSKKKLLPELQYTPYTSSTAKALGSIIHYVPGIRDVGPEGRTLESPAVIDNYIKQWGGPVGQYAVGVIDKALEASGVEPAHGKTDWRFAELPFFKEFMTRFATMHGDKQIADFMTREDHAEVIKNSVKEYVKQGDMDKAIQLQTQYQDQAQTLDGVKTAIERQSHVIQGLEKFKDMDPVQRRQLQDGAALQAIGVAKMGNKILDDLAKTRGNK